MKTVLRLLAFLAPFTPWVALSVLLGVATTASGIGLLGTSAYLISSAALHPSIATLEVAIVGVRLFGITRGLFRYLERWVSHSVNFSVLSRLRVAFYQALEPLAPAGLVHERSGDLLNTAVHDIETLENFYVRSAAPPLTAIIVTTGICLFVGRYDPFLSWGLLGGLLVGGLGVPVMIYQLNRRPGQEWADHKSTLRSFLVESIQGLSDLLAYGQEAKIAAKLGDFQTRGDKIQRRLTFGSGLASAAGLLAANLTLFAILVIAIPLVANHRMDGVSLAVVGLITIASFEAVTPLGTTAQLLGANLQSARHLFRWLDAPSPVPDPAEPAAAPKNSDLSIQNLCFRYRADAAWVLDHISLEIPAGKVVAIVGPSGAGKSSLVNLLERFWDYTDGSIRLGGQEFHLLTGQDIRTRISVINQSTYLFTGTLRYNLSLADPDAADDALCQVLALVGLEEWLSSLPNGLDTWIGEQGMQMSGGERQRLAIARALLRASPILILDEPGANLDAITEFEINAMIERVTRGRSVIWITHRFTGLEKIDEIIVMDHGKIIERGRHSELLDLGGMYFQMWTIQTGTLSLPSTS